MDEERNEEWEVGVIYIVEFAPYQKGEAQRKFRQVGLRTVAWNGRARI